MEYGAVAMWMIEFCIDVNGQETWFPVLERKRANAQPEPHADREAANQAIRKMQAVQPYVKYRVSVLTQPIPSTH